MIKVGDRIEDIDRSNYHSGTVYFGDCGCNSEYDAYGYYSGKYKELLTKSIASTVRISN